MTMYTTVINFVVVFVYDHVTTCPTMLHMVCLVVFFIYKNVTTYTTVYQKRFVLMCYHMTTYALRHYMVISTDTLTYDHMCSYVIQIFIDRLTLPTYFSVYCIITFADTQTCEHILHHDV